MFFIEHAPAFGYEASALAGGSVGIRGRGEKRRRGPLTKRPTTRSTTKKKAEPAAKPAAKGKRATAAKKPKDANTPVPARATYTLDGPIPPEGVGLPKKVGALLGI